MQFPRKLPYLGFGVGLRPVHYEYILKHLPAVDWFEVITENYLVPGGKPLNYLQRIAEHYPLVMHGVSLSIGSYDELNWEYLKQVKHLASRIHPAWISDHLCWTGIEGKNMHDLLPLPYTDAAIQHIVTKIKQVQDFLERPILLENVSSYVSYKASHLTEWEFVSAIAEEADCYLLVDINNVYVSGFNHNFDPLTYLNYLPSNRVQQFHLAGHSQFADYIIDTHDAPIIKPVWDLYRHALSLFGDVSTLIERDDHIPEFLELYEELKVAKEIAQVVKEGIKA